jgi:hypothetical protein
LSSGVTGNGNLCHFPPANESPKSFQLTCNPTSPCTLSPSLMLSRPKQADRVYIPQML